MFNTYVLDNAKLVLCGIESHPTHGKVYDYTIVNGKSDDTLTDVCVTINDGSLYYQELDIEFLIELVLKYEYVRFHVFERGSDVVDGSEYGILIDGVPFLANTEYRSFVRFIELNGTDYIIYNGAFEALGVRGNEFTYDDIASRDGRLYCIDDTLTPVRAQTNEIAEFLNRNSTNSTINIKTRNFVDFYTEKLKALRDNDVPNQE
ncbi:hypothetical protein HNP86_001786 [Methanococcus maripaludis]|uniref:Uncharacterized protein n=1 Tax=Methanococcus maripaludis TaxID=39152 RepID=A0A7J9NWC9_METMI|nr:hypothetical protein [Methanococcus maripaludis]MBA2851627.1 hypothetical protein [Methanococcus maripaludis]